MLWLSGLTLIGSSDNSEDGLTPNQHAGMDIVGCGE